MRRVDSLGKTLTLGGIGGRRRRGQQRMRWLDASNILLTYRRRQMERIMDKSITALKVS